LLAVQRDLKRRRNDTIRINGDPTGILIVVLVIGVVTVIVAPVIRLSQTDSSEAGHQTEHGSELDMSSFISEVREEFHQPALSALSGLFQIAARKFQTIYVILSVQIPRSQTCFVILARQNRICFSNFSTDFVSVLE